MDTILKFVNRPIQPTGKNFFWYLIVLIFTNLFFHILYFNTFLCTLFWKIKFIPRNIKIAAILIFSALMVGLNVIQLLVYFNVHFNSDNIIWVKYLVQMIEIFHFTAFSLFFYCIYNLIFLKNSPSSLIYFGLYNLIHAIFNNCPVISLQNTLNPLAGNPQFQNEFWQGFFGEWTNLMRVLISLFSVTIFYIAFLQLKKLNHKFRYLDLYFPWLDRQLNPVKVKLKAVL